MAHQNDIAMSKNQKGQTVSVYINTAVVQELEKDSKDQDRSLSYIVNKILEQYYADRIKTSEK